METTKNTAPEGVIKAITEKFDSSVTIEEVGGLTCMIAQKSRIHELLEYLKTGEGFSSTMLTDLFPVDCLGREPRFDVVYLLHFLDLKFRMVVKTRVAEGESIPTVSDVFGVANWLEREAYDMFGLRFEGHPNLMRILTADDFDGHPLRKDFPTEGYDFDTPFAVDLEKK